MQEFDVDANKLTAEEGWQAIHTTMDDARSSMYLAGSTAIMLLWGVIGSVGWLSQYAIETFATEFAESRPGVSSWVWAVLGPVGGVSSGFIGRRASRRIAASEAARRAGIRVCLFWVTLMVAAFLLTGAAGLWNAESSENIPRVWVGMAALGYVLFGIMHRPVIAVLGLGFAAAFYIPEYLLGDVALAVSGSAMLAMTAVGFAWVHKTGEW